MEARQRVKLTSTNDPFGLAWVPRPSFVWVGSEVPSDTHTPYIKIGNVHFEARFAVRPRIGDSVAGGRRFPARESRRRKRFSAHLRFSGGHGGGAIPDPIPNSEVKPSCADGTAGATLWESRSSPDLCPGHESVRGSFYLTAGGLGRLLRGRPDRRPPAGGSVSVSSSFAS